MKSMNLIAVCFNSTPLEQNNTDRSLVNAYNDQNIHDKIVNRIASFCSRKSILVFVPSVVEAISLSQDIPNSVAVYGDMPKNERDEAVEGFKSGKYKVAINVNVLSVGFDHPKVDCIMLARATASLSVFYQQCGRGTRIHPEKEECAIIDFVGNVAKFGKLDNLVLKKDGRLWKLFGERNKLLTGVPLDTI
jgi:DNA repair protein RadD